MNAATKQEWACTVCGSGDIRSFYRVDDVPVHSVMLLETEREAIEFPCGDIELGFCRRCGFIANIQFDAAQVAYSGDYEETQGYSETFQQFQHRLAEYLIENHQLRNKKILEIGCGKGEFLNLLCLEGNNEGLGYDPAYVAERSPGRASNKVQFVRDFFGPDSGDTDADLIVCKMTLEHIHDPAEFVGAIRKAIPGSRKPIVFIQVPDTERILQQGIFWDIYYEHCAYFTGDSLRSLFQRSGFETLKVWRDYDDQYLMLIAMPGNANEPIKPAADIMAGYEAQITQFTDQVSHQISEWREKLKSLFGENRRVVVWGGGSKAVAFLTLLDRRRQIDCAVDINPHKHGKFIAGTGHRIVSPQYLVKHPPDTVILMNPIYHHEVVEKLSELGLAPEIMAL